MALANIALDQLGAARLLLHARRASWRAPGATRTRWRTCAPTTSSATCCWSNCPTADFARIAKLLFLGA